MGRLIFFLFLFFYLSTCNNLSFSEDSYSLYLEGKKLLKQENYDFAFLKFKQLLRDFPESNHADFAQFEIAKYYFSKKDLYSAKIEFEKLIKYYPKSEFVKEGEKYLKNIDNLKQESITKIKVREIFEIIDRLIDSKNWDAVLKECQNSSNLPGLSDKEVLKLRDYLLLCVENFKRSENLKNERAALITINKLSPNDKDIINRLIAVDNIFLNDFLKNRDFASSKKLLKESLSYNPDVKNKLDEISLVETNIKNAKNHIQSTNTYIKNGSFDDAIREYNLAISSDESTAKKFRLAIPKKESIESSFEAYFLKLEDLEKAKDFDEYLNTFRKTVDENFRLFELTQFLEKIKGYDDNISIYKNIIDKNLEKIKYNIINFEKFGDWPFAKSLWGITLEEFDSKYKNIEANELSKQISFAKARLLILEKYPEGKIYDTKNNMLLLSDSAIMDKLMRDQISELRASGNSLLEEAKNAIIRKDYKQYQDSLEKAKSFIKESELLESAFK